MKFTPAKKPKAKVLPAGSPFMRRPAAWILAGVILLVGAWYVFASKAATPFCQNIVNPAYFDPSGSTNQAAWNSLISASPTVKYVIVNPATGPGTTVDSSYQNMIARLRAAGIKPLGYVSSHYTQIPISDPTFKGLADTKLDVTTSIKNWVKLYGVTDYFIDETSSDAGSIPYYTQLSTIARQQAANNYIMYNPGTPPVEDYLKDRLPSGQSLADNLIIFENTQAEYSNLQIPTWVANYSADHFTNLIYNVPDVSNMNKVLAQSRTNNAGNVYITNDTISSSSVQPWDTLASYWSDEVNAIKQGCTTTPVANPQVTITNNSTANLTAPATINLTATSTLPAAITITPSTGQSVSCLASAANCSFSANGFAAGSYTFTVTAKTSAGGVGTATTTVVVGQGAAPSVSLSADAVSYVAPATIKLTAAATTNDGGKVSQLLLIDETGAQVGTFSGSTNTFTLSNVTASHTYTAKAIEGSLTGVSKPLSVTVSPAVPSPTVLKITSVAFNYNIFAGGCNGSPLCSLTVAWTKIPGAASYDLGYFNVAKGNKLLNLKTNSYTISPAFARDPVAGGLKYSFQVDAKDAQGALLGNVSTIATRTITCLGFLCAMSN